MRELFERLLDRAREAGLLSAEHFSVDGTLVRAWAAPQRDPEGRAATAERQYTQSRSELQGHEARGRGGRGLCVVTKGPEQRRGNRPFAPRPRCV